MDLYLAARNENKKNKISADHDLSERCKKITGHHLPIKPNMYYFIKIVYPHYVITMQIVSRHLDFILPCKGSYEAAVESGVHKDIAMRRTKRILKIRKQDSYTRYEVVIN